jgi:hypothetical protein
VSIHTNKETLVQTLRCDGCKRLAPIQAGPGIELPIEEVLRRRTQAWRVEEGRHLCAGCGAKG